MNEKERNRIVKEIEETKERITRHHDLLEGLSWWQIYQKWKTGNKIVTEEIWLTCLIRSLAWLGEFRI